MIVKIYRFTTTYVLLQSTWATAQQFPWYVFDSFTYAQYAPTNEITMRGFKPSGFFIFLFFHVLFLFYLCVSDSRKTINNPWVRLQSHHPLDHSFRVTPRKRPGTDLFCFFLFSLFFFLSLLWMSKIRETHEQCTIERERKKTLSMNLFTLVCFFRFLLTVEVH